MRKIVRLLIAITFIFIISSQSFFVEALNVNDNEQSNINPKNPIVTLCGDPDPTTD